jgi:hypothetical protein
MKPDARFITAPLDEGLIVARRGGDRLFVMNGTARFMWEKRAEGVADADIPHLTALRYGIDVEQVRQDFGKTLRWWQAEGLAEPPGRHRDYAIGGVPFRIHYSDEALEREVAPLFTHLQFSRDANGLSPTEFSLATEESEFVLRTGGVEVLRADGIDAIIDKLALTVVLHANETIKSLVSIHAAAIGTSDHCVLLPGASGSGKSTLTAALLAPGRLSYLGDDLTLLDPSDLRAVPVPGTIILKRGSWEPLQSLLPTLCDLRIRSRGGQEVRYWSPPAAQVASAPLPVRAIVFARYETGTSMKLDRLPPLEGLSRLIAAPSTVHPPITADTINRLAGWARTIPFYTLPYGSLQEASRTLEDLLEG